VTIQGFYQRDRTKGNQFLPYAATVEETPFGRISTRRFTGEPGFDRFNRNQYGIGYTAERRINETFSVRQRLRYQQTELDWRQVFGVGLGADQRSLDRSAFVDNRNLQSFQVDTTGIARFVTGPLNHTVLAGIDYSFIRTTSVQVFGSATPLDLFSPVYSGVAGPLPQPFLNNRQTVDQFGIYFQDQIRLGERLVLTAGARGDFLDSGVDSRGSGNRQQQSDSVPTWRIGLAYLAPIGITPYASYSTSFLPTIGVDRSGQAFIPGPPTSTRSASSTSRPASTASSRPPRSRSRSRMR
jgi:iron complex outermembrane recepter protein